MKQKYWILIIASVIILTIAIIYNKYLKNSYKLSDLTNFGGTDEQGQDMYYLSVRSLSRINEVDPILIEIFKEAIKNSPYDFGIPKFGGKRSTEDQQYLYAKGRTSGGKIVTYTDGVIKKSYHQSGKAVDIYAYVNGKPTWEHKYYEPIARHIQAVARDKFGVELTWGGDWTSFKDLPHFQI